MLHSSDFKLPQQTRTRCRNPRCAGNLKIPVSNALDAFCTASCERAYFRCRCRVCGTMFSPKTKRRRVCSRAKCRYQFKANPGQFYGVRYPYQPVAHNGGNTSTNSTLKTATESGRAYRVVAGPEADLHPSNLRVDPSVLPRVHAAPALFKHNTPPLNLAGNGAYKFPGAPTIDLGPTPSTTEEAS